MSAANSIGEHPVPERPNPRDLAGSGALCEFGTDFLRGWKGHLAKRIEREPARLAV
jgi:hypothetical protein